MYIKDQYGLDYREVFTNRRRQTKVNNELHRIFAAKKQKRLQEEAAEEQKKLNQEAKEILQRQKRKEKKKKQKKKQKEKKEANKELVVEVVPSLSVKDLVRKGITSGAEWDMANERARESQSFQGKGPSYFAPKKPVGGNDTPLVVCPVSESDIDRAIADGGYSRPCSINLGPKRGHGRCGVVCPERPDEGLRCHARPFSATPGRAAARQGGRLRVGRVRGRRASWGGDYFLARRAQLPAATATVPQQGS